MDRKRFAAVLIAVSAGLMVSSMQSESHTGRREQWGWASWYGKAFAGRITASGERFSPRELTAAHRELPLGTKVLVKNLDTQAQVEVRINDRGPYADPKRRIIDLSRAAADSIGLLQRGVGPVHLVISEDAPGQRDLSDELFYEVQVGAFQDQEEAHAVLGQLQVHHPAAYLVGRDGPLGAYYRVRIGPFDRREEARQIARVLKRGGHRVFLDEVPARSAGAQLLRPDETATRAGS